MIRLNCPLCGLKGIKPEENLHDPKVMTLYRQAMVCKRCAGEREKAVQNATSNKWKWAIGSRHGHGHCNTDKACLILEIPYEALGEADTVTITLGNGKVPAPPPPEPVAHTTTVKRRRRKKADAAPAGEDRGKSS